jgi:type I restriction enzyme S subunit
MWQFPVFEIHEDRVFPEVLETYFRTPSIWPNISGASTGTNVRRRRLNPQDFLAYKMPVPSRVTQERLRAAMQYLMPVHQLQTETAAELDALLPLSSTVPSRVAYKRLLIPCATL